MSIPRIEHDGAYLGSAGESPSFHFAVIGDTHTHRTDDPAEQSETAQRIVEELNLLGPDFVLHAGDLIRGYTDDESRLRAEHEGAKGLFERLEMPFYPCIGNHDVREEVSERVWRDFWGGRWYSFDHGDCHFVMLDAEIAKDVESVAGEQLEWLRQDLADHASGRRLFVTLHRPWWYDYPLHVSEWKRPGGRNDWNDIVDPVLREHDLQAVFCGHRHVFEMDHRSGVPHIVAGGAGGDVGMSPEVGGLSHYLWVSVSPRSVTWSVVVPGQIVGLARMTEREHVISERPVRVSTMDFADEMPWVLHPRAARSGWHHERERNNHRPRFSQRLARALRVLFGSE